VAAHALIGLAAAAALIGHPAERRPVYSPDPPRHPFMAPNGRSNLHVDAYRDGHGCHRVWRSGEIAPSVVPKLSAANGLVYTYTKPGGADRWYLTALDFRTGRTIYKQLAGDGLGFNNNYAPVTIGPDGGIYLGVLGGMVSFHDERPPASVPPEPPALRLRSRGLRSGAVRARLTGSDIELVERVVVRLGKRRVRDSRAPFVRTLRGHGRVRAAARLRDGRTVRR
jgi:hypothetical protein